MHPSYEVLFSHIGLAAGHQHLGRRNPSRCRTVVYDHSAHGFKVRQEAETGSNERASTTRDGIGLRGSRR